MAKEKLFLITNSITLGSVLILILIGGIVRSTGAGMGCPDWPKCFGSYVPPTSADQLPDDYLDTFKEKRLAKNDRLAATFSKLGYTKLAQRITSDPAIQKEEEFSVTKAWIEYINRLVGVLIGIFVFFNMVFAFRLKKGILIPILGVSIFILTGFQGWVGSLVVSTNLLHGFITFHMLVALLIVALLIVMGVRARGLSRSPSTKLFYLAIGLFLLVIPQIVFGTEVRGVVDDLVAADLDRSSWFGYMTDIFFVHRSYSWVLLIGVFLLSYLIKKNRIDDLIMPTNLLLILLILTAAAGIGMAYFNFPSWLQPVHLLLGTSIFSLTFYLTLRFKTT